MKHLKKLAAVTAAGMLAAALTLPAMAATTYTPVYGAQTTFKKYLILSPGARVPEVTFSYSVSPGQAQSYSLSGQTMEVLAGIGTPSVTDTAFSQQDSVYSSARSEDIDITRSASERKSGDAAADGVEFNPTSGEKYAVQSATVDFSGISFPEPGIYRYVVTETASASDTAKGLIHDTDPDRILDVYVTDNGSGTLAVSGYVLHTDAGSVAMGSSMGSADVAAAGAELDDKTDGFTNEYKAVNLIVSNSVTGNQASRDKYFAVTVSLTGLQPESSYTVSLADDGDPNTADGNADPVSISTPATIDENAGKTNTTSITADSSGNAEATFYLQHGQSIAVQGVPLSAVYQVSENKEDYKPSYSIDSGTSVNTDSMASAENFSGNDHHVAFVNARDGLVPTGVLYPAVGGLALIAVGAAGLILRRRHAS